jgi:hypothetical protein
VTIAAQPEDALMTRALLCGVCLIAIHARCAAAQTLPSAADNPVPARSAPIVGTAKPANNIPEVIRQPNAPVQPKATSAPASVLTPPTIDLRFLRSIRLDWDELGVSR